MEWLLVAGVLAILLASLIIFRIRPKHFLQPDRFKPAKLVEKETITHNTKRFRFGLPSGVTLGLPVGQHISFQYIDARGTPVMRSYTPVTADETMNYVDFVIKVYPQGKMSQHVDNLAINDTIMMRGPKGTFKYTANMKKRIGMVAGGTGITPMYQVVKDILRNPEDTTEVSLVFGNIALQDIILKDELDELQREHPEQLHIYYVLDAPPEGWLAGVGHVTEAIMKEHCPAPSPDSMLLFCGPRPMVKALEGFAANLGFAKSQFHSF
eukprot:jgi/Ulvmu1/12343/UM089_0027.1